jgi:geranylgeranylglycerol-phosphate geranylgeranyltransferase
MRFVRLTRALLALIRWQNALLAVAGVFLGAWWATGLAGVPEVVVMAGVAVALTAFANADNDVQDHALDRLAHPGRPLPSGALSAGAARVVVGLAASAALVLAAPLGAAKTLATALVIGAMTLYNRGLKAHGLPGNFVVAVVASLPFLFGAWAAGEALPGAALCLVAVPLHFAREVAKDIDDAPADAQFRLTYPVRSGDDRARLVVVSSVGLFVGALTPFAIARPTFALAVLPAVAACAFAARRVLRGRTGTPGLLKSAMVFAMAAFVFTARG